MEDNNNTRDRDKNKKCNHCDNCIADILKVILILQQSVNQIDSCIETCDRGFLGQQCCPTCYNTRPIMLFTCGSNGIPLSMPISKSPTEENTSNIFRLEKLDECCATFRVLTVNCDNNYTATNSFFTINLDCLCIIRCLDDTFIECL
ncbi:MAG: hypothetical protein IJ509_02375 [Bacilli bacterium]|nr:hypothetical protein [Bacilli bacterium]